MVIHYFNMIRVNNSAQLFPPQLAPALVIPFLPPEEKNFYSCKCSPTLKEINLYPRNYKLKKEINGEK